MLFWVAQYFEEDVENCIMKVTTTIGIDVMWI